MKIDMKPDFPVTDDACKRATGKTMKQWFDEIEKKGLEGKRREAIAWMYDAMNKDIWWPTTVWVERERAKGILQKDGKIEGYNICVTKTISAPLEKVYDSWNGDMFRNWFGDSGKSDVKEGSQIKDANGNGGEFLRVRKNKDLRFNWNSNGDGVQTVADVVFSDKGKGKTGLMLNHNRIQTRNEADSLRRAWSEAFEKLKKMLEEG